MFSRSLYKSVNRTGIYSSDTYFEFVREDYDSFVLNPWSWQQLDDLWEINTIPVYLILVPILAIITVISNGMVFGIFIKERMLSSTNITLMFIGCSDTLNVLTPTLAHLYIFIDGKIPDYIPYAYCRTWSYFTKYFPTISHTSSIWLTCLLAVQRFLCICKPFLARRWCVRKKILSVIVCIYIGATLFHLCRFLDTEYLPMIVYRYSNDTLNNATNYRYISNTVNNKTFNTEGFLTCSATHVPFLRDVGIIYECVYYWCYIVFIKVGPCVWLIVFDGLMLRSLRKAEGIRHTISRSCLAGTLSNGAEIKIKHKESNRLTAIIIVVVVIVVIVELPTTVAVIIWTLSMIHGKLFIDEHFFGNLSRIFNAVIYVSYPSIFMMYCCMCTRFRKTLCSLCTPKTLQKKHEKVHL